MMPLKVKALIIVFFLAAVAGCLWLGAWVSCTPDCHCAGDTRYQGR